MKITICGSANFPEKIMEMERGLKERGHEVVIPHAITKYGLKSYEDGKMLKEDPEYRSTIKPYLTRRHFDEVKGADAILVVNTEKKGIPDYIGGGTFAEIMFAFYHNKKIFLLNPVPGHGMFDFIRDEIEATKPVVIHGDLDMVR